MLELLKWCHDMGVEDIISDEPLAARLAQPFSDKKMQQSRLELSPSRAAADQAKTLAELRAAVEAFDGCELKQTATNTVFCDGNPQAEIMFIGEAPGQNEDLQGIPFCGESGKLLNAMLEHIGIERSRNMYITNSIFWRPPGNRKPTVEEIEMCRPFVEKHIALIAPKLIVLVGSTAVSSVMGMNEPISKMRQNFYEYSNCYINEKIPVSIIFHPSYLLRQPSQKKVAWFDFLKIREYARKKGVRL